MAKVVGIILGAGGSRRLGRPKQTLPLGDTTLLGWVLRDILASSLDRVVLVVGDAADDALAGLELGRARVAYNESYGTGCASSLLAGLDAADRCDAAMLLLGDMPGVDAGLVDQVRADWERHGPWASVTSYENGLGHPFTFAASAFSSLRALHGDKAVWKLLDEHGNRVRRVGVARQLPVDVDTWDDYEAAHRRMGLRRQEVARSTAM